MDFNSWAPNDPPRAKTGRTQFGLKVLVAGEHPEVDIVAIHGINGNREESWTADNGVLWLRDILPEKIPKARIITYGYDANTHGQEQLATDYIHDHATTFIAKLATFRKETLTLERPIIFVAHSSGGIMLKSGLIHAHLCSENHLEHHQAIARSTHGVAFFGTPHQGSVTAELARSMLKISGTFVHTSDTILRHLERDSEVLQQQLLQYPAVSIDFETKFFYELYDTEFGGRVAPKSTAVVPGTLNAEAIGINKDHVNMIKFGSVDDEDFKTVAAVLALMSKAAPGKVMKKWESHRRKDTPRGYDHPTLLNLPRVDEARFDADSRPRCLEGTRVELLKTIFTWIAQDHTREQHRIFWLCGQAGTGKTTVSLTVAGECQATHQLGASFFFSRDHADRMELRLLFPTLAQQLGSFHPPFKILLAEILEQDPGLANVDPQYQFRRLIIDPLTRCPTFPHALVIIDALDECRDDDPISKFLSILSGDIHLLPYLKFFITSRPEDHIRCGFDPLGSITQSLILHDIEACVVNYDIEVYLRNRFAMTSRLYPHLVAPGWPLDEAVKSLVEKSMGLFIFAATAMDFILDINYSNPPLLLDVLLKQTLVIDFPSPSPFISLDQLYLRILQQAFTRTTSPAWIKLLKMLLGAILLLYKPLPPGDLEALLGLDRGIVRTALRHLHSIIVVPDTDEHPIRVIHPSFFDFATSRCSDANFRINSSIYHNQLAIVCFEQMKGLKRDICDIKNQSRLNSEIEDLPHRVKHCISPSIQYACHSWSYHMCGVGRSTQLQELLDSFCRTQLLYWIEAISLMDSLRDGIRQIKSIIGFLNRFPSPPQELLATLKDISRFIIHYFDVISGVSLQLYHTALPLSPSSIYLPFKHEAKRGIRLLHGEVWDSSDVTTLRGSYGYVKSLEFSPDGKFITFTSLKTIFLWDSSTGMLLKRLKDSESEWYGFVRWARVSPDGTRVISGAEGFTLRIWNVATGVWLQTIQLERSNPNAGMISCYACSPDFTCIVGAEGKDLLLWNIPNGTLINILRGDFDRVLSVAFSQNGLLIASGTQDGSISVWNAANGVAMWALKKKNQWINSIAFSPNNKHIIAGGLFGGIHLIDATNGTILMNWRGHTQAVNGLTFSPDGAHIVSGSDDRTLRVWDVSDGKLLKTNKFPATISNVAISPDGTQYIASGDDVIYLWDANQAPDLDRFKEQWNFSDIVFSPDGIYIISTNYGENDIHLWNGLTGILLNILKGHSSYINSLTFSPNRKYFASGSNDATIRLWDISRRRVASVMIGHSNWVYSVAFSPDSIYIVSTSLDKTIRIWDVASCDNIFTVHPSTSTLSADFSADGSQIITRDCKYDIPLQFRSYPAHPNLNSNAAEGLVYSSEEEWVLASRGSEKERCMKIPRAWRPYKVSFHSTSARVAFGIRFGLVLLDLSGIKLSI